jgi:hypothetical protein
MGSLSYLPLYYEICVPDFQVREILLYLYDLYDYLSKIVSGKKNLKYLCSSFFNEIFKMVKRNVEK